MQIYEYKGMNEVERMKIDFGALVDYNLEVVRLASTPDQASHMSEI